MSSKKTVYYLKNKPSNTPLELDIRTQYILKTFKTILF